MNLGDFQGKEASEQRIRELCGGMISGESPVHTLPLTQLCPSVLSALPVL